MSEITDDMEAYSGFCDEEPDEFDLIEQLQDKIAKLEKIIYGMNIKINRLEFRIKDLEK